MTDLRFGDKVKVKKEGFYHGSEGLLIYESQSEGNYTVMLAGGVTKDFFPNELKKVNIKQKQTKAKRGKK